MSLLISVLYKIPKFYEHKVLENIAITYVSIIFSSIQHTQVLWTWSHTEHHWSVHSQLHTSKCYGKYFHCSRQNDRREGKCRRCLLGDSIDSSPCRASYRAPGWFEERDEFILFFMSSRCNSSYSSYWKGAIYPILQIVLMHNSLRSKEINWFCPPNSSDDFCLFFCFYPSSMVVEGIKEINQVYHGKYH